MNLKKTILCLSALTFFLLQSPVFASSLPTMYCIKVKTEKLKGVNDCPPGYVCGDPAPPEAFVGKCLNGLSCTGTCNSIAGNTATATATATSEKLVPKEVSNNTYFCKFYHLVINKIVLLLVVVTIALVSVAAFKNKVSKKIAAVIVSAIAILMAAPIIIKLAHSKDYCSIEKRA